MQSSAQSMEKITCLPTRNQLYHEPNGGSLRGEAGEVRVGGEKRERDKGKATLPFLLSQSPLPFPSFPLPSTSSTSATQAKWRARAVWFHSETEIPSVCIVIHLTITSRRRSKKGANIYQAWGK